ncbi:glutamate--cysteine ligase [Streptomyces sp. NPDC052040]|uniref:glutamate--cysteine ligase n=1 Tax=Streptomyces sp. NPDC052040 TaxID=3365682 RepID=UPI0037D3B064
MTTVGVEEEYLLIDPVTGRLVPRGEKVRARAGLASSVSDEEIQPELLQAQIEVATPVCATLEEAGGHLLRLRHAVAEAARACGCRVMAGGTPPPAEELPVPVTDRARYREMQRQAPQLVAEQLVNGMHVHVAVPDRETGVEVLNRLRAWLPTLTAMSANSPLWEGHDTGFASWRTIVFDRWPVSGVPPLFADAADYDRRVGRLLATGVISDPGQLYWQARLSESYPTVEIRCLDVQLRADDAVMFTGLIRALADTAVRDAAAGGPAPGGEAEFVRAAMWQAARHGLSGDLIDPGGVRRPAADVVGGLLERAGPALDAYGDTRLVTSLVTRLLERGTGAELQRRALAAGGVEAVTRMIVDSVVAR